MKHQTVKVLLLSTVLALTPVTAFAETATEEAAEAAADTAEDDAAQDLSAEELKALGEKATEADYQPIVKNAAGKEIKSVEIQINDEDFGENLLAEGDTMAVDEARVLYCTPAPYNPETDTEPPKYNIRLTFSDDTSSVIHTFPFGDAETVDFCLDGSVAYLKFHSLFLDEDQDTLRNERALLPVKAPSYYSDDSSYSYSYSSGGGGGNSGGGGGGNDEECLTGGLMF